MNFFKKIDAIDAMHTLWNNFCRKNKFGYISFLEKGEQWDLEEFHLVGERFVNRMVERFEEYGDVEMSSADILEIGCGVGRFMKPLSQRFKFVCGVDISEEMLTTAREYCADIHNVKFILNDGTSLNNIENDSFDYCVSAGVFQHITDINVILKYISEAIRILKPCGVFLFQFEGNRKKLVGKKELGAKITAKILDNGLNDVNFIIREVSNDPKDSVRNVVIVLQKPKNDENTIKEKNSFQVFNMTERAWISGVYDDIKTKTSMHKRQKRKPRRLTFYD